MLTCLCYLHIRVYYLTCKCALIFFPFGICCIAALFKNQFLTSFCLLLQTYLQIILESLPAFERRSTGIHGQQVTRLQELVEFIQSQVCSFPREIVLRIEYECMLNKCNGIYCRNITTI